MGMDAIRVTGLVPASTARVYEAYLDGDLHAAMTGAPASVVPSVGGRLSAWGDYIDGEILELGEGRIVQTWRASDFPADAGHSRLEVLIEPEGDEARVTFIHSDLPEGMGETFVEGWERFYLKPMREFFAKAAPKARPAKKPAAARAVAKPAAKAVAKPVKKARPSARKPIRKAAKKAAKSPAKKTARKAAKKASRKPVRRAKRKTKKGR